MVYFLEDSGSWFFLATDYQRCDVNCTHTQARTLNLQVEKHDGYQGPLRCFVDDVGVGEPVIVINNVY